MSLPKRTVITTADGSKTLYMEAWNEHYHSIHGAIQEAYHVFIRSGLDELKASSVHILEIGFGTGLNALISYIEADRRQLMIDYLGVEAYPVPYDQALEMDYTQSLRQESYQAIFEKMHLVAWDKAHLLSPFFKFYKRKQKFEELEDKNKFDLIYFDAFGFRVQPELWSVTIFTKMYAAMKVGGILVTYAAKGEVRRTMQAVGFQVERLPGPPGKREMLRARKIK